MLNVLLAVVWVLLTGSFTGIDLLFGFAVGYVVMRVVHPLIGTARYPGGIRQMLALAWHILELAAFFVRELVVASARIVVDVLTPQFRMQPGVIAFPLELESSTQITLLANLISLTPGTLSLDVSEDRRTLFIHVMYVPDRDVDAARDRIKRRLEPRVRRALGDPRP